MVAESKTMGYNDGVVPGVGSVGSMAVVGLVVPEEFVVNLNV